MPHTRELGTEEAPYDAGPTGPLCAQGGLNETALGILVTLGIQDTVAGVIEELPIPGIVRITHMSVNDFFLMSPE